MKKALTYLTETRIGHKVSLRDRDVQAFAVLDRAVQNVKRRFTRLMARTGKGDETLKLQKAFKAHNSAYIQPYMDRQTKSARMLRYSS